MDFVPVSYSREQKRRTRKSVFTRLGIGAATLGIPTALAVAFGAASDLFLYSLPIAAVGSIFTLVATVSAPEEQISIRKRERAEQIRSSLNEHYGLNLSAEQFRALDYPNGDPGPGFQTYGSIKIQDQLDGGNFLERTLYLNSTDGNLVLSESRDGKRFKELKPARRSIEGLEAPSPRAVESPAASLSISA